MSHARLRNMIAALAVALCASCASTKPSEVLDERTGATVGALREPIEFVASSQHASLAGSQRSSFAYLGPVEWDTSGDLTYALWIHIAPGNDKNLDNLRGRGAVTLNLDDGPVPLAAVEPKAGNGPYRPVASWGQSAYFAVDAAVLKRMATSRKLDLDIRAVDQSRVEFVPTHETRATLTDYLHARGLTAD